MQNSSKINRLGAPRAIRLCVGVVTFFALSTTGPVATTASAASKTSGSLVFTGALKGTLKLGPTVGVTPALRLTLSAFATTLPSEKFKTWSVAIFVTKLGTCKKFKFLTDSFVLGTSDYTGWIATKGSMTVIATSGTVNLTLGGHEGLATGTVHVAGTWYCGS